MSATIHDIPPGEEGVPWEAGPLTKTGNASHWIYPVVVDSCVAEASLRRAMQG